MRLPWVWIVFCLSTPIYRVNPLGIRLPFSPTIRRSCIGPPGSKSNCIKLEPFDPLILLLKMSNNDDTPKDKLRTSHDVLNRLRFDTEKYNAAEILVGYLDRIQGPMEMLASDFDTEGKDIAQHRIVYFRRATPDHAPRACDILWDRQGRVDRIFEASGKTHSSRNSNDGDIHETTLQQAQQAYHTMQRLAVEQAERKDVQEHNRQAREIRRQLAAQVLGDNTMPSQESSSQSTSSSTSSTSRKRQLTELSSSPLGSQTNSSKSSSQDAEQFLQTVNRLSLEAIFHPKFDNEKQRDSHIRQVMKEKVQANEGYLEVSLKHSGSLILWSGGQRYYSKNSTDNAFTTVAEILLRQHLVRAFWNETNSTAGDATDWERHYHECSQYIEQERLTLAFEVVTAVLGDHGARPPRDFLILTAVADRHMESFFKTDQVVAFAQRFRLPHNDFWTFTTPTAVNALFHLYDTSREKGTATSVMKTLNTAADSQIPSLYPHMAFQGEILEGIVIRYVSNKRKSQRQSSDGVVPSLDQLTSNAQALCETVPASLPDCPELLASSRYSTDNDSAPAWLTTDLRKLFFQNRLSGEFKIKVQGILGTQGRRTATRLKKEETPNVPQLLSQLQSSEDEETRRIAKVIDSLTKLNIRVDYSLAKEEVEGKGFQRWLCIIHVILDNAHQVYRKKVDPRNMSLFRGFAVEFGSTDSFSSNLRRSSEGMEIEEDGASLENDNDEAGLMLKMKFLPYMVRTFGCRNGLSTLKQSRADSFMQYTSNLLSKWGMSVEAREKWLPYFQSWAEYASPRLLGRVPEDGSDMPELTSDNYLDHLERFNGLIQSGEIKMGHAKDAFRGFVVVVAPKAKHSKLVADLVAQEVGCKVRYSGTEGVPPNPLGGLVCDVSIEDDRPGRFHKFFNDRGVGTSIIFVGCSDNEIKDCVDFGDFRIIKGKLNGWKKLSACFSAELSLCAIPNDAAMQVEREQTTPDLSEDLQMIVLGLQESGPSNSSESPGILVFFPQIPGCGKSSVVNADGEKELEKFLDEQGSKRKLQCRMGDKTQGKFWNIVRKEKAKDKSGVYIADKNVPSPTWDLLANVCADTSAIGVPIIPGNALKTEVIEGVRFPDGFVSMKRSHTFPFRLHYLAVCMLRVYSRKGGSHPGKLDSSTKRACLIVVMFYCLYDRLSADDFLEMMKTDFERNNAFLARDPVEVPFFRQSEPKELPSGLRDLLVEAIRAQRGLAFKKKDIGKFKDPYLDDLETRLRNALEESRGYLSSLTVDVDESRQAFLEKLKDTISQAESNQLMSEEGDGSALCLSRIRYVSVDVSPSAVHEFLLSNVGRADLNGFWKIICDENDPKSILRGVQSTDDRLIKTTHVTLAHTNSHSQKSMKENFGPVNDHDLQVAITGLLWDNLTAALEVQLPAQTDQGATLAGSINDFEHVTLWTNTDTKAKRSNELPLLVKQGKAQRVAFSDKMTLPGKLSFQS